MEGPAEIEIIKRVKDALISLDDGLTVIWGEEFDRRVQVPKPTPVLSDDVGDKQTKASSQPQKQYLCSACDRSFKDNASKRLHMIAKHQDVYQQWVHQCEFCGGRWEQKRGMSVHKTKCPNKKK